MTPEVMKGLIDWLQTSSSLVGEALEDYQKSKRPPGVSEAIVARLIADASAPAPTWPAQIARDSSGSWRVEGLEMVFLTRADAESAAHIMARVREIEASEGVLLDSVLAPLRYEA